MPAGAIVSAIAAGIVGVTMGADPLLVVLVPLMPLGYTLAVIDARTRLLPRRLVVPATLAVVAALVVEWVTTGDLEVLVRCRCRARDRQDGVLGAVVLRRGSGLR